MKAKVSFFIESPAKCTEEQFMEWIRFKIGVSNFMKTANPLCDRPLDLIYAFPDERIIETCQINITK